MADHSWPQYDDASDADDSAVGILLRQMLLLLLLLTQCRPDRCRCVTLVSADAMHQRITADANHSSATDELDTFSSG